MRRLANPLLLIAIVSALPQTAPAQVKPKDKSKPVRRGIEEWYARITDGFRMKDIAAIMALRTGDFHTVTPDGRTNDRAFIEPRTWNFLAGIEMWLSLKLKIGTIEVAGDRVSALPTQNAHTTLNCSCRVKVGELGSPRRT